ncbi:L-2-amino-thiazoline-4-carboxylic acid hydrolase [Candidatus Bipolaricaulota bacterium]
MNREVERFAGGTGYRWEAMIFLAMWEEVESRYGREEARRIGAEVARNAGIRFGQAMARVHGRNDLAALKEVWEAIYPPGDRKNEWTGDRFVVRGNQCIIKETYESLLVLPDDLRAELCSVFCEGDRGFVEGFNPSIRFSWGGRVMRGDPECVWNMEEPE